MMPFAGFGLDVDGDRRRVLAAITEAGPRGCDECDLVRRLGLPPSVVCARIGELLLCGYIAEEASAWVAVAGSVLA